MNIKLPTKDLKDALNRIAHIPGANGASIHTQIVTLTADPMGLTLARFTSEAKIAVTIDEGLTINGSGITRVAHQPLTRLIGACNTKEVELIFEEKCIAIVAGKSRSRLKSLDEDILADPPPEEMEMETANILLEDLVEIFGFVGPAASRDKAGSYSFCGVALKSIEGKLSFIATDRRRCHIENAPFFIEADCVIPSEGVDAILKAIATNTGPCIFGVGETSAKILTDTLDISVTLLSEKYPPSVQKFFSQAESSIESKFIVQRNELVEALDQCAGVNDDDARTVQLDISPKLMIVSGTNNKDSETEYPVDCQASGPFKCGVGGRNMSLALSKMPVAEDGTIEIKQVLGALFTTSDTRKAFFTVAKPQA